MKRVLVLAVASSLFGCGGGGDSGQTTSELEGSWVWSSAGHLTGAECGLDSHGAYESRVTYTFTGNKISGTAEECWISKGNTGVFLQTNLAAGTFTTGPVYLTYGADSYKELNLTVNGTTKYSGYSLNGNKLKLPAYTAANDGSSPQKRATGVASTGQEFARR